MPLGLYVSLVSRASSLFFLVAVRFAVPRAQSKAVGHRRSEPLKPEHQSCSCDCPCQVFWSR